MDERLEKYIKNIGSLADTMSIKIPYEMSEDEAISMIQRKALDTYLLHEENDAILREFVYSKKPEELTDKDVSEVSTFASALFSVDKSAAYLCHKLLHDYAVIKGDRDLIIRSAYFMGLNIYYLSYENNTLDVHLFMDRIAAHFGEAAEYYKDYDNITSAETRGFIIRAYANRKLSPAYFNVIGTNVDLEKYHTSFDAYRNYRELYKQTIEICRSEKRRAENPEIPWDSFINTMYQGQASFAMMMLRYSKLHSEEYDVVANDSLEAITYVYEKDVERFEKQGVPIPNLDRYLYFAIRYHAGLVHPNELVAELMKIYHEVPHDDFTSYGIYANLRIPTYLDAYRVYMDAEGRRKYGSEADAAITGIYDYLMRLPRNQYIREMSRYLRDILMFQVSQKSRGYRKQILNYILACHPPTYIHSHMVAWLCEILFLRILETDPESLKGIMGFEYVPSICSMKNRIAKAVYQCGLYHDLGKCMIIEQIGNYSRRLTDEEFSIIKLHPILGSGLLKILGSYDLEADAALYHHVTYDRKGGYPANEVSISRASEVIVDILSVADSLDAGTDNIGRCYAASKTVDDLIGELKRGSGTRYAPYVVKVFDDESFCKKIKTYIDIKRRKIYVKTYMDISREEK